MCMQLKKLCKCKKALTLSVIHTTRDSSDYTNTINTKLYVPVNHLVSLYSKIVPSNFPQNSSDMHLSNSPEPVLHTHTQHSNMQDTTAQVVICTLDSLHKVFLLCRDFQVRNDQWESGEVLGLGLGYVLQRANWHSCECNTCMLRGDYKIEATKKIHHNTILQCTIM